MSRAFHTLLIANRGEIACRIARSAHAMGLRVIAVYSEADRDSAHVAAADEALCIGPAQASGSYLDADKLLDAVRRSGAQAVHPGYGFLSERADFAEACGAAGVTFVGPSPSAIREMGDKAASLARMSAAGVPVLPGYHGADQSDAALLGAAAEVGYPLMVKPSAGGGGKGMRAVHDAADLGEALGAARREAAGAFGDDTLLLERLLLAPRHIEVQVLADTHGRVVHLLERDCSLQRRHQKVVEEAPGVGIDATLRDALGSAAVRAAEAIGYVGAGTVEFLLDSDGQFYFMEMNTRLQVEHPVTEQVLGIDLVAWQLRIAAGEQLDIEQSSVVPTGHAIEVRLYAEDPENGFLPATGTLDRCEWPQESASLRIDSGVREGDVVSPWYDPMLAKLISHGSTRRHAITAMARALEQLHVVGLATNTAYLHAIVSSEAFAEGGQDTRWLERAHDELVAVPAQARRIAMALAACWRVAQTNSDAGSPFDRLRGWQLNAASRCWPMDFIDDGVVEVRWPASTSSLMQVTTAADTGQALDVSVRQSDARGIVAEVGGTLAQAGVYLAGTSLTVHHGGRRFDFHLFDRDQRRSAEDEAGGTLAAPMPGTVVDVFVKVGDSVQRGTRLMLLEAMKMEHTIAAPADGVVTSLGCAAGDMVTEGQALAVVEIPAD